ncbi:Gfo/Idh/MocA family protein [Nakamurella lactea]|uniref:Gfo/Idh/MocA family protein n=1 Tax=Nakamurella lactea TaxID=459515 RepID=UPI000406483A|nr:Gfo/Idh/MocA family oxidoreductase [Nakamurella lactea]
MTDKPTLGVGMVGYAFMGRAHSIGWRTAPSVFDLPVRPEMRALVGRNSQATAAAAAALGWADTETDWRALLDRDDIDLIDICTPGDTHAEIAIAALAAGKHVLCEKPLANTVSEAEAMAAAAAEAERSGVRAMVGFNYRRVPAAALARELIAAGRLGTVRHVRAVYLQDWIVDPQFPLVWRLRKDAAGSGALGDIGAHIIDLAQFMLGEKISGVSGLTETFVKTRPLPEATPGAAGLSGSSRGTEVGEVTVDDATLFTARFAGGAVGSFEATRFATGRKNELRIEVNGSAGSLVFDMESMNELLFYDGTEPDQTAGFRKILVTEPTHPYLHAWWPPGHLLGWDHSFVHEVRDLVTAIADGGELRPSFADGLQVQRVLQAVLESAEKSSSWQQIPD